MAFIKEPPSYDLYEKGKKKENKCRVNNVISPHFSETPGPENIKTFSCPTQLSMIFQLLIKSKMLKNKDFFAFILSDVVLIMLINVKMPTTIVGNLTFMSMINLLINIKMITTGGI